jgi:hypothetical protein
MNNKNSDMCSLFHIFLKIIALKGIAMGKKSKKKVDNSNAQKVGFFML